MRKYVPELKDYDKKYIYEPWKAPIVDQKKWKCQVSGDGTEKGSKDMAKYPKPMFDFNEMRQFCIDKVKAAYDTGLYGDDEKVMSGEWKKIFGHKEGKTKKDEAVGEVKSSKKRARTPEEHEHDDGKNADVGDPDEEEEDHQEGRQSKSHRPTRSTAANGHKGKQAKIDGMVQRGRRKA